MRLTALIFMTAALSLCLAAKPVLPQVALPDGFDGTYVPMGSTCADALQATVQDGVVLMMDGSIMVTDLIEDPVNPRRVEATLELSAGGGEWTDSAVLTLSEDGTILRFDYADGTSIDWVRCD